jgi:protein arginine kinase activator
MLCEICNKKEAVVHIQEIVDGEKKTIHMCQECAASKGVDAIGLEGVNIAEILYNLSTKNTLPDFSKVVTMFPGRGYETKKNKPIKVVVCSNCKWNSDNFQKTGKLGCEKCYKAFSDIISKTISNIQKGNLHIGKRPGENTSEISLIMMDILNLQKKLEEYVLREEFEKAADIRDQINQLKTQLEAENKNEK